MRFQLPRCGAVRTAASRNRIRGPPLSQEEAAGREG